MALWQLIFILIFGLLNFGVFIKGYRESKYHKRVYTLTPNLNFLGIFVWGDTVVSGLFWAGASLVSILLDDWYLFLLIASIFWVVRSLGETIYWFNQQFSVVKRNPPEKLNYYSVFQNDSVWFVYQIIWQCVTVVSVIFTIYFTKLWLDFRF